MRLTLLVGLAPSAVLNVEFQAGRINARSQAIAGSASSSGGHAVAGDAESWPSWILRVGLTFIMLPFRAVGYLFGQQQRYDPLPQAPAPAAGNAAAGVGRAPARRERQVEFYNGADTF